MTETTKPTVLIVEDEEDLAEMFGRWLRDAYDVRIAYNGGAAIEAFDDTVDVALLDRRLPDISGDEVLEHVRSQTTDCWVAMVTAVTPDVDLFEMGFDDYVVKPVGREQLLELVERLLDRAAYDRDMQRHFALATKLAVLEEHLGEATLAEHEEYAALLDELDRLDERLRAASAEMDPDDVAAALRGGALSDR